MTMNVLPTPLRRTLVIATLAAATLAAPRDAAAQQADSLPRQSMTVERDFVPVERDADKLSRTPAVEPPQALHATAAYADWIAPAGGDTTLAPLPVGQVFDHDPFDDSRGYLRGDIGNYMNANLRAAYRILESAATRLAARAGWSSTRAEIEMNHPDASGATLPDWRNTETMGFGAVTLTRRREWLSWSAEAGYRTERHDLLNRRLIDAEDLGATFPRLKQKTDNLSASVAIDNHDRAQRIEYAASLTLEDNTWSRPDGSELLAQLRADVQWAVTPAHPGGIEAEATLLHYHFADRDGEDYDPLESGVQLSLMPYLHFDHKRWQARIGARADLISGPDNHFAIAPAVRATYDLRGRGQQFFADVTGGLRRVSQRLLMEKMPFYLPVHQYKTPWTIADVTLGYRHYASGSFGGELYVGAAYTLDALIPYATEDAAYGMTTWIGNEDDLSIRFGGKLTFTCSKYFAAEVAVTAYAHTEEAAASYEPTGKAEVSITSAPAQGLLFALTYSGLYARSAWLVGSGIHAAREISLGDYNSLALRGSWQCRQRLRLYAEIDNLLGEERDVWLGVPGQRLNAHIGASWQF